MARGRQEPACVAGRITPEEVHEDAEEPLAGAQQGMRKWGMRE